MAAYPPVIHDAAQHVFRALNTSGGDTLPPGLFNPADYISAKTNNKLTLGEDFLFYVPGDGAGAYPGLSTEIGNRLRLSTVDSKLFVPPVNAADLLSFNCDGQSSSENLLAVCDDGKLWLDIDTIINNIDNTFVSALISADARNIITTGNDGGLFALNAGCISADPDNQAIAGSDGCIYVPSGGTPWPGVSTDTPNLVTIGTDGGLLVETCTIALDESISTDQGNLIHLGTDGGLLVDEHCQTVIEDLISVEVDNRLEIGEDGLLKVSEHCQVFVEDLISADPGNALVPGQDGSLYVPVPTIECAWNMADLISTDPNNAAGIGGDGKLFLDNQPCTFVCSDFITHDAHQILGIGSDGLLKVPVANSVDNLIEITASGLMVDSHKVMAGMLSNGGVFKTGFTRSFVVPGPATDMWVVWGGQACTDGDLGYNVTFLNSSGMFIELLPGGTVRTMSDYGLGTAGSDRPYGMQAWGIRVASTAAPAPPPPQTIYYLYDTAYTGGNPLNTGIYAGSVTLPAASSAPANSTTVAPADFSNLGSLYWRAGSSAWVVETPTPVYYKYDTAVPGQVGNTGGQYIGSQTGGAQPVDSTTVAPPSPFTPSVYYWFPTYNQWIALTTVNP